MAEKLIMMMGLPGAGKSTLALALGQASTDISIFSNDEIRAELGFPVVGSNYTYKVYTEAIKRAGLALAQGKIPVLDSTFYKKIYRRKLFLETRDVLHKGLIIELVTDPAICKQRILKRAVNGESKVGGVNDEIRFNELVEKTEELDTSEIPQVFSRGCVDCANGCSLVSISSDTDPDLMAILERCLND